MADVSVYFIVFSFFVGGIKFYIMVATAIQGNIAWFVFLLLMLVFALLQA